MRRRHIIPAKAGIQSSDGMSYIHKDIQLAAWIPAFAGMMPRGSKWVKNRIIGKTLKLRPYVNALNLFNFGNS